jgi:hypothetical protein
MPHPVLGIVGDMEGEFNLKLKFSFDSEAQQYLISEIIPIVTNNYIHKLYQQNLADLIIKISCIPTYKTWTFINSNEIRFPENEVDLVIELEAFLICNIDIAKYFDDSFNSIFVGTEFQLEKGDIIALTGPQKIAIDKGYEKTTLGSIFRFSRIGENEDNQEIHFDFDEDQIVIYYPNKQQEFDPVVLLFDKTQGVPFTALNIYIIPALTQAFEILEKNQSIELRWAFVLNNLLPVKLRSEDHFISAQKAIRIDVPVNLAFKEFLKMKKLAV